MIATFKSHCKVCGKPLGVFDNDTCRDCERWLKVIEDIKADIEDFKKEIFHRHTSYEAFASVSHCLEIIDRHTKGEAE